MARGRDTLLAMQWPEDVILAMQWPEDVIHYLQCNSQRTWYPACNAMARGRDTLLAMQWPEDTALSFLLFWRRSTASSVFRVGARGRAFVLSSPPGLPSPSLISYLAPTEVNQNVYLLTM